MQLAANAGWCHASNRLRTQAVAVPRTAKHCSGNEALQGWSAAIAVMSEMQLRGMQAGAGNSESNAAQTEPFKAECSAVMLSSMQLAAKSGLLH